MSEFKIGDKVAYDAAFCRNTGQQTGPIPFARGIVTGLQKLGERTLVIVDWGLSDDAENIPTKIIDTNLVIL